MKLCISLAARTRAHCTTAISTTSSPHVLVIWCALAILGLNLAAFDSCEDESSFRFQLEVHSRR
ncbi:hypothetical protein BT96DRAFT_927941 [Gymnopus androsaceus JB14]|uniref:Uncharacterized protein n=1 Tax=Gymnopus androsaceus JB14 TaxID=1447944 RepID=A0A6A4GNU0_9AGAR|nr:hypothetical protein BT96DRAFT_927941 [Gymnopus androsaceus JB14]